MHNKYIFFFRRLIVSVFYSIFAVATVFSQTAGCNYMMTTTPLDNQASHQVKQVQYYDGLGRPTVLATGGLAPGGKYVYSLQEYDGNGRESTRWLPVPGGTSPESMQKSDIVSASSQYYSDGYAFSTTTYDALGRPTFISTPGDEWFSSNKGKTIGYVTNTAADQIKKYRQRSVTTLVTNGETFAPGTLTGEITEDEDGHRLVTYKDMLGRIILQRRDNNNDTYFVYNEGGQLRFVLMPQYQEGSSSYNRYEYRYDDRGRCVKKYLPNRIYTDYWYDCGDRVMFLRDGYLRAVSRYRFFLYDNLGRVIVQGTCSDGNTADSFMTAVAVFNAGTSGLCGTGYTPQDDLALTDPQIEVVNYYDDYTFLSTQLFSSSIGNNDFVRTTTACAQSLLTGVVTSTTNGELLCTAYYYDAKGQVIDMRQTMLGGNYQKKLTSYTFTGQPASVTTQLRKGSTTYTTVHNYSYNDNGQLSGETLTSNGLSATIAEYSYDCLGRLSMKSSHNGRVSTMFEYDLHGWPTKIESRSVSDNIFTENLKYADGTVPTYNGNISEMTWKVGGLAPASYHFAYDGLNRMTDAIFYDAAGSNPNLYCESVSYDANSNITLLTRTGHTTTGTGRIDRLNYATYTGNQLKAICDSVGNAALYDGAFEFRQVNGNKTTQYAYDNNGAMKYDLNRGVMRIDYDLLGNPKRVQFYNGNVIEYIYAADGTRLRTIHRTAVRGIRVSTNSSHTLTASETLALDSTDYVGAFLFHGNSFSKYLFDGGYVTYSGSTPSLHFYLHDHQGNNWAVAEFATLSHVNASLSQTTYYYPYGGVFGDLGSYPESQPYKYNGKEFDRMHGLDWYDYGARQYDPAIARFTSMDPLTEKYYHISPYAYCAGNPVNYVDLDGRSTWVIDYAEGQYQVVGGNLDDNDRNIYVGSFNKDGIFVPTGPIGVSTSMTSFYNTDTKGGGSWQVGSIIDMNDNSGDRFLSNLISNNPPMIDDYMLNARNNHFYDFKVTNGTNHPINGIDIYRGMPIDVDGEGKRIVTSARDIGNIAAGYVAGINGMPWGATKIAFDIYQGGKEGKSTRNAEYYGWCLGNNNTTFSQKLSNLSHSFVSAAAYLWNYLTK